jgi:hypothetical protein
MKTIKIISYMLIAGTALSMLFTSCESNPEVTSKKDLLPQTFSVDIPSSISNSDVSGGRKANGRMRGDSLKGNDMYRHLGTFIAIGEGAAKLVEGFIHGIRRHNIDRVMTMTFIGDDDGRVKNLVVNADVEYEGTTWDYQLTVTDADSEGEPDGGRALQIFWNAAAPIKGIAIIKPYNCDRPKNQDAPDAIFRVNYSEEGSLGYDKHMEVLIAGFPFGNALQEPFGVNSIRMFVGKKGDVVDVFGNSNHPNAVLFSGEPGFNWAFVAAGNDTKNLAVAEVGLPPSTLDTDDREVILKEYSIINVFTNNITEVWPGIDPQLLASYLAETAAPGYFDHDGFISGGISPGTDWDEMTARLKDLTPYNPKEVAELSVTFR